MLDLKKINLEKEGKLKQDIVDLLVKYSKETGVVVDRIDLRTLKPGVVGVASEVGVYTGISFECFIGDLIGDE